MNNGTDIQQELREMGSKLAGLPRSMPYSVPSGYFGRLDGEVKDHCLAKWGKQLPYTTPVGYFEQLPGNISALVKLDALTADLPFSTPPGYFEQLPQQILAAAKNHHQTNSISKRKSIPLPARWAAAAVLVLGIGISAYRMFYSTPALETPTEHILASVQTREVEEYIDGNYRVDLDVMEKNDDLNKMKLDKQEIIKYLDETGWDM